MDTCCHEMALILRAPYPALLPTPNNIRKEQQSFLEIVSLPPTSPADFLRFFAAFWAFYVDFLFYSQQGNNVDKGDG
ncbi:CLUMA_CG021168, isoform A [Clunio marinus]|uniref:CLUMA_CG021168, isoform A n=1 Tax=Clunio marinus TaxID=568069 RepID=A0A1J1J6H1_9DIPT|nr:CLUMA_CG021168, isoform A [Clunio marinus]